MEEIKTCRKCGVPKSLADYLDCKTTKDKKQSWCRECQKEKSMEHYQKNKDKLNARRLERYRKTGK